MGDASIRSVLLPSSRPGTDNTRGPSASPLGCPSQEYGARLPAEFERDAPFTSGMSGARYSVPSESAVGLESALYSHFTAQCKGLRRKYPEFWRLFGKDTTFPH